MNIISVENGLMTDFANKKCSKIGRDFANKLETSPTKYFLILKLRDALILFLFVFKYSEYSIIAYSIFATIQLLQGIKKSQILSHRN